MRLDCDRDAVLREMICHSSTREPSPLRIAAMKKAPDDGRGF